MLMSDDSMTPLAHGPDHDLVQHLHAVAARTAQNLGAPVPSWAWLAGLWHDLGKFRPGFQRYIRIVVDAHLEGRLPRTSDKTHSAAGALHAIAALRERFG